MTDLDKQLQSARQSLLDLTLRNRLLHFRPSPVRTIRMVDEIAREVFDLLVLQEKSLTFRPQPDAAPAADGAPPAPGGLTDQEVTTLWGAPLPEEAVEARHADRNLQTALDGPGLQKRLFNVYQQARTVFEEQGYTVLYLALGFLEWSEPGRPAAVRAPLVLVPVELERTKVGAAYRVAWTGEDLITNISLQAKLAEQGIRLPDFEAPEEKGGLDRYLQAVAQAVAARPAWRILADIVLDFFSFMKFVMYKDLDPRAWPEGRSPAEHPLIRRILAPSAGAPAPGEAQDDAPPTVPDAAEAEGEGFPEEAVDERLRPRDLRHVLDADPSQIAVIEDVKAGRSLVVEGPPGTGKSQTITNLIAELLAAGKSVLFVSEKMAALEVVKGRLDRAGLGDFCLELHSRKANKREMLRELERVLGAPAPKPISLEGEYDRLEALQAELNAYAKALREPVGALGRTPWELFGMKERARSRLAAAGRAIPRIEIPAPEQIGPDAWPAATARLTALAQAIPMVAPVASHPWRGCAPEAVLPADEEEIGGLIDACGAAADRLTAALGRLAELSGIAVPAAPDALGRALAAAKLVGAGEPVDAALLLGETWDRPREEAAALAAQLETLRSRVADAQTVFEPAALDRDVPALLAEYRERSAGLFRFLSGRWGALKREVAALYRDRALKGAPAVTADLERLAETARQRRALQGAEAAGRALFGTLWKGEAGDPERLRAFAEWAVVFRKALRDGALSPAAAERVAAGVNRAAIDKAVAAVAVASKEYVTPLDFLTYRVKLDFKTVFGAGPGQVPFAAWAERLALWKAELAKLPRWAPFAARRTAALKTVGAPVVAAIDADALGPDDVLPAFEASYADELLRRAFAQRPALAQFVGELHEKKVAEFAALDRELIGKGRPRLAGELVRRRPRPPVGASPGSEAGILLGEINRKRGHMPIRRLMAMAGGLVQKVKPCFMMSPLSIAQFLDPRTARFDVVVFDEASQVRPEDALGALLRGSQAVVMGDTRQLPPTRFFDHLVEAADAAADEEAEAAAGVGDVESILHQCRRAFPAKTLRWHYRSRHESLIAVSNREFYDSRLLVYPSAIDRADDLGLQLVHLPDTVYDRGRGSVNRQEARAVAEAAVAHARRHPRKSLGVGAFNIRQQQAILEEVELQLRAHPDVEPFFGPGRDERFFVKNLETIQGDERDVIFLSLGFGFDEARKLSLNFGPLNQDGGERRLNVLISRARERCAVFANFRAADLALPADAPAGLRALRTFLRYAETRELARAAVEPDAAGSALEDAVAALLEGRGLQVRRQVGCAGFRVDLAVVDPGAPGRYALAVELDGPAYHASAVARDRDRLRRQILESLGWRIHVVWSTDWYRDRAGAERALQAAVDAALKAKAGERPAGPGTLEAAKRPAAAPPQPPKPPVFRAPPPGSRNPEPGTVSPEPVPYAPCASFGIPVHGDLAEQPPAILVHAIQKVVIAEGPVHVDEMFRRVRELWGLKRMGERIQEALANALYVAVQRGAVRQETDFLWPAKKGPVPVRTRGEDPRIELICDEEIAAALAMVLRQQFATKPEDLVTRASRLLGFQLTSEGVATRIRAVMEDRLAVGALAMLPNGMVDLPK